MLHLQLFPVQSLKHVDLSALKLLEFEHFFKLSWKLFQRTAAAYLNDFLS